MSYGHDAGCVCADCDEQDQIRRDAALADERLAEIQDQWSEIDRLRQEKDEWNEERALLHELARIAIDWRGNGWSFTEAERFEEIVDKLGLEGTKLW